MQWWHRSFGFGPCLFSGNSRTNNHSHGKDAIGYEFCAGNTHLCSGVEKPTNYGAVMYAPSVAAYAAFSVAAVAAFADPRGAAVLVLFHDFKKKSPAADTFRSGEWVNNSLSLIRDSSRQIGKKKQRPEPLFPLSRLRRTLIACQLKQFSFAFVVILHSIGVLLTLTP